MVAIRTFSEEQYVFIKSYIDLMRMVDEGLSIADQCYRERNYGSGDMILADVLRAFPPLQSAAEQMKAIFIIETVVVELLTQFQALHEQVQHLQAISGDQDAKVSFLQEFFLPSYQKWDQQLTKELNKYTAN